MILVILTYLDFGSNTEAVGREIERSFGMLNLYYIIQDEHNNIYVLAI